MKIRKTIPFFIAIMIFSSTILFGTLIYSQTNNNQEYFYRPNNSIVEFYNFSSFQILYDEPGLSSIKSDSHINFTYYGGSSGFFLMRYYYLDLTDYGNISDFDMEVTIDYNYTGSISFGRFMFIVGSFYDESDGYSGEPDGTESGFPWDPAKPLCCSQVVDSWTGFGGEFRVIAWPDDVEDKHLTAHGVPGLSGTGTFYMNRVNDIIYCQVNQSNSIKIDHIWTEGVTKPMNFILIGEGIYAETTNFASASFYDFSAKLNCSGIPIEHPIIKTITETETDTETETETETKTETELITITAGIVFSMAVVTTAIGITLLMVLRRRKLQ